MVPSQPLLENDNYQIFLIAFNIITPYKQNSLSRRVCMYLQKNLMEHKWNVKWSICWRIWWNRNIRDISYEAAAEQFNGTHFHQKVNICDTHELYISHIRLSQNHNRLLALGRERVSNTSDAENNTLYRLKTSVVSLVASYQARRFTTWVISVRRRGRTMCFFPREVRNSILAKAGTSSLDKLTFSNMTPFISSWETCHVELILKLATESRIILDQKSHLHQYNKWSQIPAILFQNSELVHAHICGGE